MARSTENTLEASKKGLSMQIPEGVEMEELDHLCVPAMLLHGQTPEERRNDVLFSVVIRAYLRDEISMMKVGEFLGCQDYKSTCQLFKANNIPTIKKKPLDVIQESERNRKEMEKQLGL